MKPERKQAHPPSFGDQLRRFRESRQFTQAVLAERAGLTVKAISALERGERQHPFPHTVQVLVTALNLSPAEQSIFIAGIPKRGRAVVPAPPPTPAFSVALPLPPTGIVGREQDVTDILNLWEQHGSHLLTLTGPGGVGKTRLALHLATIMQTHYRDGVVMVSLASVQSAAQVMPTLAATLQLRDTGETALEVVHHFLRDKHMLIVLDNFEHVSDAAAAIAFLMGTCPSIRFLATSRSPLEVRGEQEYPLTPLEVPTASRADYEAIAASPAVQLFMERAHAVAPAFALNPTNAATIAEICRRLDGLPLAIELAAARIKLMTPGLLLSRLDNALPLLVSNSRDLPERQQTMRHTIAWSYQLLTNSEQQLFRALSVFSGGWTLEAAETVCTRAVAHLSVMDGLTSLLNKSLIVRTNNDDVDAEPRFRMLDTISAYASEQLEAKGEANALLNAHMEWCATLLAKLVPSIQTELLPETLNQIAVEMDNVRRAWTRICELRHTEAIARAQTSLWWFHHIRGLFQEGAALFGQAAAALLPEIATVPDTRPFIGILLARQGWFAMTMGQHDHAQRLIQQALAHFPPNDTSWSSAEASNFMGLVHYTTGAFADSLRWLQTAYDRYKALAHVAGMASAAYGLSEVNLTTGDYEQGYRYLNESLTLSRASGDVFGTATYSSALGYAAAYLGRFEEARQYLAEGLALSEQLQDRWGMGKAMGQMGAVAMMEGDLEHAKFLTEQSLVYQRESGDQRSVTRHLCTLAEIAFRQEAYQTAQQHFHHALRLALDTKSLTTALRIAVGIAKLYIHEAQYATAYEWVLYALNHPASSERSRQRAITMQREMEAYLSPSEMERVRQAHQPLGFATAAGQYLPVGG